MVKDLSSCFWSAFLLFSSPLCVFLLPCSPVLWQSRVLVSVSVGSPDLFHVVLHYVNQASAEVLGRVLVLEGEWSSYCANCECCQTGSVLPGSCGDWWLVSMGVVSLSGRGLGKSSCCCSTFPSFSSKTFLLTYQFRALTFLSAPPLFFSSCSSFLHLHLLFSTVSLFLSSSLYLIPPCSSPCSSVFLPILHHILLVFYLSSFPCTISSSSFSPYSPSFSFPYLIHSHFLLSPLRFSTFPLFAPPVDCSEASGSHQRGRRLSDSLHSQIHEP